MVSSLFYLLVLGSFFVYGNAECPRIISREEWGARPPNCPPQRFSSKVPYVIIHHGGTPNYCTNQSSCAAIVRAYQDYHMDDQGWDDIGFNFVVGEDGNVYEGRGWNVVGAHAGSPYNPISIGICIIGDFTARLPNGAALCAVWQLIRFGVVNEKISSQYLLKGHRQVVSTDCPGDKLYEEIKQWPQWAK